MQLLKKNIKLFILSLLGGLSFAPTYFVFFLPFMFFLAIKNTLNSETKKEAFFTGVIFGFGFYLTQLYWISFSLFVDIKSYFWLVPFAVILIPLASSFFTGLATLLFYRLVKKYNIENKLGTVLLFSFSFIFLEYLKAFLFPWNLISYVWAFSDTIIQLSSILNIYLFNLLTVFLLSFIFVFRDWKNLQHSNKVLYFGIYLVIPLSILMFGAVRLGLAKESSKLPLNIRIVQANIKQDLKWDREMERNNLEKHLNLTLKPGLQNIDLIIWPESAITQIMTEDSLLPIELNKIKNKYLISGALRADVSGNKINKIWNSAIFFKDSKIINTYDKSILVPFGEFIPFGGIFPFFRTIAGGGLDFSKGRGNETINVNGLKISPIICYEVIFPFNVIDKNNKPDVIVNITNDAWFGISSGPYQHLAAARFRAVENSIPLIRVNNSGVSAYIDKYGRVIKKIGLDEEGYFDIYKE